jgi:phosphatidylserine/phosphatidylglycerophosphate/cardiolipin synthase-like enzyme
MDFAGGDIQCFLGPDDLGGPDDLEDAIVGSIDGATKTIDVAVQEIDCVPIAEALIRKRLARVSVRVILNHSYLQEATDQDHRPDSSLQSIAEWATDTSDYKLNRDIYAAFARCGVEVRMDLNPEYIFHHKFVVVDARRTRAGELRVAGQPALLTGSANFTHTDCHRNLNHLFVFRDRDLIGDFATEFAEMWGGEFSRGRLGEPPKTRDLGGVPAKALFSPDHGPEAEIVKQMLKCSTGGTIDFAIFTFSGSSAIDDAMITLAGAGRTIRGAVDRGQARATAKWPAMRWLVDAGIDVRVPRTGSGVRKLHHKLMVIDRSTVIGGSFNYTEPAHLYNDEVLIVLGSPYAESEGVQVDRDECRRLAEHAGTEIDRILALCEPWPPP